MALKTIPVELSRPNEEAPVVQAGTTDDGEDVVLFTSFDGTVREVGELPMDLGRATALAGEKTISRMWGSSEEEAAYLAMQKEM